MSEDAVAALPADVPHVIRRAAFCREWGISWAEFDAAPARAIGIVERYGRILAQGRR